MPGDNTKHSKEWGEMFDALVADGMDEEQAAKIATAKIGYSAEEPETFELKDVEVFQAGKWKGEEYTVTDLDNMVNNFDLLGRKYKAPLKLGHDDKQKLAQADGFPAIGWVKELKRSGEKLLATFTSVPKKIKQLIDNKAYGRFSSEILWNFSFGGNIHKRVLRAVALLGADMPAVTSISDIISLYSGGDIPTGELHAYHDTEREESGTMEEQEKLKKDLEESNQKVAKLSEDVKSKDDKIAALEAENQKREAEAYKVKVYAAIDEGIKAGKIAPVQREHLAAMALVQFTGTEQVFKYSDGEIKASTALDVLAEMIGKLPVIKQFTEEVSTIDKPEVKPDEKKDKVEQGGRVYSTDESLDAKVKAIQKEKNCTYAEAFKIATQEVK